MVIFRVTLWCLPRDQLWLLYNPSGLIFVKRTKHRYSENNSFQTLRDILRMCSGFCCGRHNYRIHARYNECRRMRQRLVKFVYIAGFVAYYSAWSRVLHMLLSSHHPPCNHCPFLRNGRLYTSKIYHNTNTVVTYTVKILLLQKKNLEQKHSVQLKLAARTAKFLILS